MSDGLRCMHWPFGVLCWLDMAGGGCRNRAVCWLHDHARSLAVYVGMLRPSSGRAN